MRGWGWRREWCERAGLEEERVCEGGVGGREGCEWRKRRGVRNWWSGVGEREGV